DRRENRDRWSEPEKMQLQDHRDRREATGQRQDRPPRGNAAERDDGHDQAENNQAGGERQPERGHERRQPGKPLLCPQHHAAILGCVESGREHKANRGHSREQLRGLVSRHEAPLTVTTPDRATASWLDSPSTCLPLPQPVNDRPRQPVTRLASHHDDLAAVMSLMSDVVGENMVYVVLPVATYVPL